MVEAELAVLSCGCLNPDLLAPMPVAEVFDRYSAGRRVESERRRFAIEAAVMAWMDKEGRAEVQNRIDQLARTEVVRRRAFDLMDDTHRVIAIGDNLLRHGDRWADDHPAMIGWLDRQGVTQAEAIERHKAWHREHVTNPRPAPRSREVGLTKTLKELA